MLTKGHCARCGGDASSRGRWELIATFHGLENLLYYCSYFTEENIKPLKYIQLAPDQSQM